MNNEKLNTALYQKMEREQDKYCKWLVQCPPEEILSHAYEYAVREDILMAMEELNLPDDQAMALLKQRGPLDDVFKVSVNWKPTTWKRCAVRSSRVQSGKRQRAGTGRRGNAGCIKRRNRQCQKDGSAVIPQSV